MKRARRYPKEEEEEEEEEDERDYSLWSRAAITAECKKRGVQHTGERILQEWRLRHHDEGHKVLSSKKLLQTGGDTVLAARAIDRNKGLSLIIHLDVLKKHLLPLLHVFDLLSLAHTCAGLYSACHAQLSRRLPHGWTLRAVILFRHMSRLRENHWVSFCVNDIGLDLKYCMSTSSFEIVSRIIMQHGSVDRYINKRRIAANNEDAEQDEQAFKQMHHHARHAQVLEILRQELHWTTTLFSEDMQPVCLLLGKHFADKWRVRLRNYFNLSSASCLNAQAAVEPLLEKLRGMDKNMVLQWFSDQTLHLRRNVQNVNLSGWKQDVVQALAKHPKVNVDGHGCTRVCQMIMFLHGSTKVSGAITKDDVMEWITVYFDREPHISSYTLPLKNPGQFLWKKHRTPEEEKADAEASYPPDQYLKIVLRLL